MRFPRTSFGVAAAALLAVGSLPAQIVISGNESKIDLNPGTATVVQDAESDSISILDFSVFPPKTTHIDNISNTVIGPPSNIAITPNNEIALIADSVKIDPADSTQFIPHDGIHVLDLTASPPKIIGHTTAGQQPSGMSITPNGKLALVANRAGGTVSVLSIDGKSVTKISDVKVCEPEDSASDVAISPDRRAALVSIQNKSILVELAIDGNEVKVTGRNFAVYGKPYRVIITPDGDFAITSGAGFGGPNDLDAVSFIDLRARPPRTVQHITTGASPESLEISPDGKLLAVVTMDRSNLAADDPLRTQAGGLHLYRRSGKRFEHSQSLDTGRIPEGVAFTSDGKYLIVQCHPDREMRIYRVRRGKVNDTGERVGVPGMPSSIRAAM